MVFKEAGYSGDINLWFRASGCKDSLMFGDNKSVIMNMTLPSSTLKKKHNAITYHRVREAVAAGIINLVHIPGIENIADVLTKPLGPQEHMRLVHPILF